MEKIIFLGTSRCLPTRLRENSSLYFMNGEEDLLVDCGGISYHKFLAANIDTSKLKYLIGTHFHPDHCSGIPLLIISLWLSGRTDPLIILGLSPVIQGIKSLLQIMDYGSWKGLFPLVFEEIEPQFGREAINNGQFRLSTCPTDHAIPSIAVKYISYQTGKTIVYSSDTRPCLNIRKFASGADIFIRECNYADDFDERAQREGHSTARQVGEEARKIELKDLFLIHHGCDSREEVEKMRKNVGPGSYQIHIPDDLSSVEI